MDLAGLDGHIQSKDVEMGCHPQIQDHEKSSRAFSGASKQVGVDPIPIVDERHVLVGLEEEVKVLPKKTPSKLVAKKAVRVQHHKRLYIQIVAQTPQETSSINKK